MLRTLTHKVTAGAIIYILILALVAGTALFTISRALTSANTLLNVTIPLNEAHHQFYFHLNSAIQEAQLFAFSGDVTHRNEAEATFVAAQDDLATFDTMVANSTEAKGTFADLQRQQTALVADVQQQITKLTRAGAANDQAGMATARADLQTLEARFDALDAATDALTDGEQVRPAIAQLESQYRLIVTVVTVGFIVLGLIILVALWVLRRNIIRPIKGVSSFAGAVAAGDLDRMTPVTSNDEIGELQQSVNCMVGHLREQQSALVAHNAELQHSVDAQQQLLATVQQLSTPLLTLNNGVLLLPLIGHVDTQRGEAIMQALLHGVSEQRARVVILDVTGLADVDTQVGQLLLQAVRATELLGAQVLLVGVTAVLAQVIIAQGIDLSNLRAYRDVGAALREAVASPLWIDDNGASNGASLN